MLILNIDMDGVTCDFDKRVIELLGASFGRQDSKAKIDFWHDTFTPEFFLELDPAPNLNECIDELWDIYEGKVRILTALPKHRKDLAHQCATNKIKWARNHIKKPIPVTFGPFAVDKQLHCSGSNFHLIDDKDLNIEQWNKQGGVGFYHKDIDKLKNTVEDIKRYLLIAK